MIIAWIVVGYLLLFIPIVEYASYRNYKKQIADNTFRKQSFYNSVFVELWTPVICLIVLAILSANQMRQADDTVQPETPRSGKSGF